MTSYGPLVTVVPLTDGSVATNEATSSAAWVDLEQEVGAWGRGRGHPGILTAVGVRPAAVVFQAGVRIRQSLNQTRDPPQDRRRRRPRAAG